MPYTFETEIGYEIGQEFVYKYSMYWSGPHKFKITGVEIHIKSGGVEIKYLVDEWNEICNGWRYTNEKFSEERLSNVIDRKPHKFSTELKFNLGDKLISGVNGQDPNDIKTYKGSNVFCGDVFEVTEIVITVNNYVRVTLLSNRVLYDGFIKHIAELDDYDNYHIDSYPAKGCAFVSEFDVDSLINIICKEMVKKQWVNDPYRYLYNKETLEPEFTYCNIEGGRKVKCYGNCFSGLFKYLGVEDKAKETFKKFYDAKYNDEIPIKPKKLSNKKSKHNNLNDIVKELSDKERQKLLKLLQNSSKN